MTTSRVAACSAIVLVIFLNAFAHARPKAGFGPPASAVQVRRRQAVRIWAGRRAPTDVPAQIPQSVNGNLLAESVSAAIRWVGAVVEPVQAEGVDTPCTRNLIEACGDIAPGYGALRTCVDNNWKKLQDDCGLKAQEAPEEVAPACLEDSLVLCKHISPGNERVTKCLQSFDGHWNADGITLSKDCISALKLQSAGMNTACAEDVTKFCIHLERSKDELLRCLRPHQHELRFGCTIRSHLYEEEKIVSTHVNLHTGRSAEGCAADIRRFCRGVKPGHGLIHACLLEHRAQLSPDCWVPRGQVVKRNLPAGGAGAGAEAEGEAAAAAAGGGGGGASPDPLAGLSEQDREATIKWDIEQAAFRNTDVDDSASLDIHEFIEAMSRAGRDQDREKLREEFVSADTDGSGFIEEPEFHALFGTARPPAPPAAQAPSEGEEESGPRREFSAREESLLERVLRSPWVTTPLVMAAGFVVFVYRSIVRRSAPGRPRKKQEDGMAGVGSRRGYR